MPLMRIPYTDPLPLPKIYPLNATTYAGAIAALAEFLTASPKRNSATSQEPLTPECANGPTLLLTGAGISVASGLADYRGTNGTYTLNKTYRPIYYNEFVSKHECRRRYWARSFLGWTNLNRAKPNGAHHAVARLGELGRVGAVITQNVDSFHPIAHPSLPTIELHGYLRSLVCLSCRSEYPRSAFQTELARLNPAWATFLAEMLASGALNTEHPEERRARGLKTNPDGDVDVPNVDYGTFRYPACPVCIEQPPILSNGERGIVKLDKDGSWDAGSTAGVLKPAVIMFGESIPASIKEAAETAVDTASRLLVIGSSLATYSAWRLAKRAKERGLPIGILNLGGVRMEEQFFREISPNNAGAEAVRVSHSVERILPDLVRAMEEFAGNPTGKGIGAANG